MNISATSLNRRLLLLALAVAGVYFARPFLVPLIIGAVLATLFLPLCKWLERKKVRPLAATLVCMGALLLVIVGMLALLGWQVSQLAGDMTRIRQGLNGILLDAQDFVFRHFDLSGKQQQQMILDGQPGLGTIVRGVAGSVTSIIYYCLLILVYMVLMLYYRAHVRQFILLLFRQPLRPEVDGVLNRIAAVSQQYLLGLFKMIVCLWVMYGVGFSLLGVENALFFAFVCGILEIVPYVGNITGTSITLLVAAAQGSGAGILVGILVVYATIQFVQGWLLEPLIVGPQVKVNPLATILALVIGELLWGIAGVFLAIPVAAMLKIVCDHIEPLKPIGFLLGDKVKGNQAKSQSNEPTS